MGLVSVAGALIGGALFTWASIALVLQPTKQRAIKNFLASLIQLLLLLSGAIIDGWLVGSFT